jgi:predicted AAA+ superfamily ATPase
MDLRLGLKPEAEGRALPRGALDLDRRNRSALPAPPHGSQSMSRLKKAAKYDKVAGMIKTYVKRDRYLAAIEPFIGKDVIKVIIGQRRVGKSCLLLQVMDAIKDKGIPASRIIYVNKELHEFEDIQDHRDLLEYVSRKGPKSGRACVFIDEIQEIAQFEKALRSMQASGRYDIYCTGSNARLLSGELATTLGGRCVEVKVFGLSYAEFLKFHKLVENPDAFAKYIRYGGLPYLANLKLDDEVAYEYLRNIYGAILLKDIVARHGVRNVNFLERLVEFLADNTGRLVSAKRISDFLKSQRIQISPNVVLNYLSLLASAFFVFKVPRADVVGKKVFEIGEKYYFEDLGLRHSIIGFRPNDVEKVLENLVFLQLKMQGFKVAVGKFGEREIDFVCEKAGERLYVQVCYLLTDEKVRDREFGNLLAIPDNFPKLVVSMDELPGRTVKGIMHVSVREFLLRDL